MTDPTEAEARGDWLHIVGERAARVVAATQNIDAYDAQLRATERESHAQNLSTAVAASFAAGAAAEREKARTLVKRLTDDMVSPNDLECWFCGGNGWNKDDFDHTEDCPWVEARLWLDGGAE